MQLPKCGNIIAGGDGPDLRAGPPNNTLETRTEKKIRFLGFLLFFLFRSKLRDVFIPWKTASY